MRFGLAVLILSVSTCFASGANATIAAFDLHEPALDNDAFKLTWNVNGRYLITGDQFSLTATPKEIFTGGRSSLGANLGGHALAVGSIPPVGFLTPGTLTLDFDMTNPAAGQLLVTGDAIEPVVLPAVIDSPTIDSVPDTLLRAMLVDFRIDGDIFTFLFEGIDGGLIDVGLAARGQALAMVMRALPGNRAEGSISQPLPEPGTFMLLAIAGVGWLAALRLQRRQAAKITTGA